MMKSSWTAHEQRQPHQQQVDTMGLDEHHYVPQVLFHSVVEISVTGSTLSIKLSVICDWKNIFAGLFGTRCTCFIDADTEHELAGWSVIIGWFIWSCHWEVVLTWVRTVIRESVSKIKQKHLPNSKVDYWSSTTTTFLPLRQICSFDLSSSLLLSLEIDLKGPDWQWESTVIR